ncbi:hypothetical protein ScalyP_jg4004 [Parmales sp. scaly parma]|nr:hypothetical protein ScalyP_jg4004 [Parmales sp. scaly parma]
MFCLLCAIGCCTAYNTSFLRIDRTKTFRHADLTLYVTHPPSLPPSQTLSYLVGSTTQASSFLTTLPSSISSNTLVNNLNFESPNLATSSFTLAKTGDVLVAPTAEEIAAKKASFNFWFWGGGIVAPFIATVFYFGPKFWEK